MSPARSAVSSPNGADKTAPKAGNTVTLRFQDEPLTTAINFLTQQADVVIANNDGLKDKTVTVNLKDKPIEEALDQILKSNGIPWYRDDDGTYVINARRPAPKTASPAPDKTELLPAPPAPAPVGRFVVTEKIELIHISPDQALAGLGLPNTGLNRKLTKPMDGDYNFVNYGTPKPTLNILDTSNSTMGTGTLRPANPTNLNPGDAPSTKGDDTDPSVDANPAPIPDGSDSDNAFNRSPEDRDQYGQGAVRRPGFTPRSNVPTAQGTPGVPPGAPGANNQTGNGINGGARGFVPPGIDLVAGMQTDNSLLVQGTPDDIEELRNVIRLLDVAPQQVSIKVDVITVSTSALRQFGGSWQFFTKEANINAQFGTVPSGLTVDVIRGNAQAVIGALTTNGRGRVIASPIVTTVNNIPANIQQGETVPVFLPVITTNNGGTISQTQAIGVQATTGLYVQPTINRDGTITLTGQVQIQNIVRLVSSPDGTTIAPETNQTSLGPFIRRVASGETLVIGGLNSKSESEDETKIPLLGDIPLIGKLFRSRTKNNSETQMLMFITPNIVTEHANEGQTNL
jgi:type II secretory pathway component GspD/PulD (secretin)